MTPTLSLRTPPSEGYTEVLLLRWRPGYHVQKDAWGRVSRLLYEGNTLDWETQALRLPVEVLAHVRLAIQRIRSLHGWQWKAELSLAPDSFEGLSLAPQQIQLPCLLLARCAEGFWWLMGLDVPFTSPRVQGVSTTPLIWTYQGWLPTLQLTEAPYEDPRQHVPNCGKTQGPVFMNNHRLSYLAHCPIHLA